MRWEVLYNGVPITGIGNNNIPVSCPTVGGSIKDFYIRIERVINDTVTLPGTDIVGNIEIKAYFYKNGTNCNNPRIGTKVVSGKGYEPGVPVTNISTGELTFCNGNETKRVLTSPGFPSVSNEESCGYHNGWNVTIPSGWTAIRVTDQEDNDPQYNVTSPSSVSSGYHAFTATHFDNGEHAFYSDNWFNPINGQIWVGTPASMSGSVSGPTSPSVGSNVTYYINSSLPNGASSFEWILPYSGMPTPNSWSIISQTSNQVTVKVGSAAGWVQVRGKNICGSGGVRILYVTPQGGGGGIQQFSMAAVDQQSIAYPNPSQSGFFNITVKSIMDEIAAQEYEIAQAIDNLNYIVQSESSEVVDKGSIQGDSFDVNISSENAGVYYLKVRSNKDEIYSTRLIK